MNIKEECLWERRSTEIRRDLFYSSKKPLPIANHIMIELIYSPDRAEIHFVKIEGEVKTSASLRLSFLCVKTEDLFDFVVIPTKSNNSRLCWY
jgi:hypothetical protein